MERELEVWILSPILRFSLFFFFPPLCYCCLHTVFWGMNGGLLCSWFRGDELGGGQYVDTSCIPQNISYAILTRQCHHLRIE